jgi:hypothetical protein
MLRPVLPALRAAGVSVDLVSADHVAEVAERILAAGGSGEAWSILGGEEPRPIRFPAYGP